MNTFRNRIAYKIALTLTVVISCLMCACSNDEIFRVSGTVKGNPTMNLRAVYYGDDALQTVITPVRDGKFDFTGNSRNATIVELYDNEYKLLGRLYAKNGDHLKCTIDRNNPYDITIEGNDINTKWSKWLTDNNKTLLAGNPAKINDLVSRYVSANKEDVLSSLLIVTLFDASTASGAALADSLLSIIEPQARPQKLLASYNTLLAQVSDAHASDNISSLTFTTRTDSIHMYIPEHHHLSLLAFSDEYSGRGDSIVPALRRLSKAGGKRLEIVDFSLDTDTFTWARIVRNDTASWTQAWRPGGIMAQGVERLKLPAVPYFIVVDSAGAQLLRTPSVADAEKFLKKRL